MPRARLSWLPGTLRRCFDHCDPPSLSYWVPLQRPRRDDTLPHLFCYWQMEWTGVFGHALTRNCVRPGDVEFVQSRDVRDPPWGRCAVCLVCGRPRGNAASGQRRAAICLATCVPTGSALGSGAAGLALGSGAAGLTRGSGAAELTRGSGAAELTRGSRAASCHWGSPLL